MLCRAVVIPRRCFEDEYICDSSTPQYGFKTWDDLRVRPIASPKDDAVITNACESAPYRLAINVQQYDHFWLKTQPYCLSHMLADDGLTLQFIGGKDA